MNYLSIMKKTATFLAIGATVLGALAADRADDGRGLIEAYASNNNFLSDVSPFRWYAGAITGGSSGGAANHAIDRSNSNTWAPESIYQLERWGVHTITFTGLVPGATYLAELHLTENYFGGSSSGGAGSRIFNVVVNDVTKESNLDVYSAAGGPWRALCRQYEVTADASGTVAIRLANVTDNAHTSGAALFGSVAPSTPGSFEANVPDGTADIVLTWSPSTDVRRYYLQRGESASGPWTDVAELFPETSGTHTLAGVFDAMQPYHYRLVASNGVGTAVSSVASYLPPSGGNSLKTRGSTVADDASAIYRIDAPGQASDPVNALASDAVAAQALILDYAGDSELALGTGQTLTLGILGVGEAGGNLTLSGGGTLVAARSPFGVTVDNPASCLKVDAAASGAGLLTKNGGGRLELNGGHSGFTKFTVNAGVLSAANASAANAPLLSGTGTVEKTGGGVLTVASANPDFSGDLVVREGTLQFNVASPFASADGRIVVEDGAALDVAGSALAAEAVRMASRTVVVEGAGPDGRGAIVNTSSNSQYNALAHGSLAGDATFGGGGATLSGSAGRWDFRNGSLAMNGHNIEKVGSNMVCLTGVALDPGGTVRISVKEGYWSSETTTGYSGGSANVLDVYGGAFFDVFYLTAPFTWTLNLRDGAAYKVRDGTSPAHNVLNGPVVLEGGTAEVQPGGNCRTTFNGVVSGPGFLWVRGSAGGRLSLMNAANSYSGGTLVSGGDLYADSKGALPGYGSADTLSVSNGTLILNYAEGKWSADDLQEMANSGILFSNSSFLALSMTNEMELARAISFDLGSMSLYDGGTLRVTQPITLGGGALEVHERTGLVMDGEFTSTLGMRYSGRAGTTLVLTNGAALLVSPTASATTLAGSYAEPARAVVAKDSTLAASTDCAVNAASAAITIGGGENQAGILTVDGGTVRHKVVLGMDNAAGGGALIQHGGVVENQGGSANDIRYGNLGYGFVELNGGTHTWWGYGTIGGASASGRGAMYQHGGVFDYVAKMSNGRLGLSRGACGVFYMDGGTIDWTPAGAFLALGESDNPTLGPDSFSTFTLDGADAYADFGNKTAWLGNRTNHTAVINLNNGGTLRNGVIAAGDSLTADRQTLASYLNFDGGVFRAAGNISMFRDEAAKKPDAVTVYPGGAVLDTDQYTLTVNAPLERPSGSGVASVAMPDALAAETRFIGPPLVRISGGGGRGATAICLYDSKTRKVTGVKVTCPGTGYTSAPTVTFEGGLGATNRFTGTATLAANSAAGGLVKRGSGLLVLAATNTFGGAVTVEGGTLFAGCTNAIPSGADLLLRGGTLTANTGLELGAVSVTSGNVANAAIDCASFTKEGDGVLSLHGATVRTRSQAVIGGGCVRVGSSGAGLLESVLSGYQNWTGVAAGTNVTLSTVMANTRSGWGEQMTIAYTGYIWNRSDADVTWTFVEDFDDAVRLWIDDELLISNDGWQNAAKATVTLSPGPHKFEARFGQGTGGAGPTTGASPEWTAKNATPIGFAIDFEGRDSFDGTLYTIPVDPGDGSLFTVSAAEPDTALFGQAGVTIASGAALDFVAATAVSLPNLSGAGSVTNATVLASGTWTFDADDFTAGKCLTVANGAVDLSGVTTFAFENAASLPANGAAVVIARADKGFTGAEGLAAATLTGLPPKGSWHLEVRGNSLVLSPVAGTAIIIR